MLQSDKNISRRDLTVGIFGSALTALAFKIKGFSSKRSSNGLVSTSLFGVKADGVTDDSKAMQACVDYCEAKKLVPDLPTGEIYLGRSLNIPYMMNFVGKGPHTEFIVDGNITALIFNTDLTINPSPIPKRKFSPVKIGDFSVRQKSGIREGRGIWMRDASHSHFSRIGVRDFDIAIDTRGATWSSTIKNCWIVSNNIGIMLGATDKNFNLVPDDGNGSDIVFTGMNGGTISGCEIQANNVGIYAKYELSVGGVGRHICHGLNIVNNIIEGNFGPGIILSGQQRGASIISNYFEKNARADGRFVPGLDVPSIDMDWKRVKANIVFQEDPYGFGVVAQVRDNRFATSLDGTWAVFQGRGRGNIFEGNEGFTNGIYAQQVNTSLTTLGLTARDNSFNMNIISPEILVQSMIQGTGNVYNQIPIKTE